MRPDRQVASATGERDGDAGDQPAVGRRSWLGRIRRRPLPARRTVVLSLMLLALAMAVAPVTVLVEPGSVPAVALPGGSGRHSLPWWLLAVLFVLAAVFVFHVEVKGETHTFSLSEVPLVLGLFFVSPQDLLLARLVGEMAVLVLYERQGPVKLTFNLSLFLAESVVALTVFHWLIGGLTVADARSWLVALVAVAASALLGVGALWTIIRWHDGRPDLPVLLLTVTITTVCNTALAAVAAVLVLANPLAVIPLLVVAALLITAYRGYTGLARRYAGLDMLYQFTSVISGSLQPRETLASVLDEARTLMRADLAVVSLLPVDGRPTITLGVRGGALLDDGNTPALPKQVARRVVEGRQTVVLGKSTRRTDLRFALASLGLRDCLVAPLLSGGVVTGTLLVGDRIGEVSTFDNEDARLFATLASQAGVALENGRLVDRLDEQARAREYEALHDSLTGLPNRAHFTRRVAEALAEAPAGGAPAGGVTIAVFLLDLDRFKEVNDTLGHHIGDQLLEHIGARLARALDGRGLVARLGGDEFAVLLTRISGAAEALAIGQELYRQIAEPVQLPSVLLDVGASIGIAVRPEHGDDLSSLLQRADVAMYTCKRTPTRVALYDPEADWSSEVRLRLAADMREALRRGDIKVHFQPIATMDGMEVVVAEALARWTHPELGPVGPTEFVAVAERTGQIEDLTRHVLDLALTECARWRTYGLDLKVAVNLPVQVLLDATWPDKLIGLLNKHRVPADRLVLEIPESGLMSDLGRFVGAMRGLTERGITIAVDDFGTGYSSLAQLQRLPISVIKIDQSLVMQLATDPAAATVVRSLADLAAGLSLEVVAEGAEDQRTVDLLRQLGCDYVQGYALSRPIPAAELTRWLVGRSVTPALRAV